jgi:hypothetical protein
LISLAKPITVSIHGKHTKPGKGRGTWLTSEMAKQLNEWMNYKYRARHDFLEGVCLRICGARFDEAMDDSS